jgi:uncharacterized protein (UPF0303 family)
MFLIKVAKMLNLSLEKKIERYEYEEEQLQFTHFSNEDALTLGLLLIDAAKQRKVNPAFEIKVNGYIVFHYGFPGTNRHNEMWLRRKSNTVNTVHMSSLHVGALLEKSGQSIENDWFLPAMDYAWLGGGFPIILKGTGVIGSVCCSGLPHEKDHQIVVDTISEFLGISLNET